MADDVAVSLRERKHAETKVSLAKAAEKKLLGKKWAEISVKELVEEVSISEVTFYNYFPKKTDLFKYLMRLWSLDIRQKLTGGEISGLAKVELFFDLIGDKIEEYPNALGELRLILAQDEMGRKMCKDSGDLSELEKHLAYPENEDITSHKASTDLGELIAESLKEAIQEGEIPKNTDLEYALFSIGVIFHGVTACAVNMAPTEIKKAYNRQVRMLCKGLNVK